MALVGPASAQSPIVIKFSHVVATNTPKGLAAEKFKELAEKYTDGKVKVEVYPNSQLYKDKEELEALQLGAVQMLAPSNSKFGPIGVKEFEVFDLPYILPDLATLRKVTDGPLGAKLLKLLDAKGMIGLAYWDNGFKQMSANKKLLDAGRLQGRQIPHPVLEGAGSAIPRARLDPAGDGVLAKSIRRCRPAWSTARKTPGRTSTPRKCMRCRSTSPRPTTATSATSWSMNKKFWDGLPADIRAQCEKAMKEATAYGNGQSQKENDDALAEIKKTGKSEIITLTPEQDAAMRKAMEPVYKDVASRVGQPLIDEFLKETRGATN